MSNGASWTLKVLVAEFEVIPLFKNPKVPVSRLEKFNWATNVSGKFVISSMIIKPSAGAFKSLLSKNISSKSTLPLPGAYEK